MAAVGACMAEAHVWQGGMHGGWCAWQGACVAAGHAQLGVCMIGWHLWQGACVAAVGVCMAGDMCGWGACVVGGMHGRGHAWWGACMVGDMCGRGCAWQGVYMSGKMAIAVDGVHTTGMHSFWVNVMFLVANVKLSMFFSGGEYICTAGQFLNSWSYDQKTLAQKNRQSLPLKNITFASEDLTLAMVLHA